MANISITSFLSSLLGCVVANGSAVSHAQIKESDILAKLQKVTIRDLEKGIIVLTPDAGRTPRKGRALPLSPLLATTGATDHNCACDAVIVRERSDGQCEVSYVDLKSDNPSGHIGQFKGTRAFMRYIVALTKEFHSQELMIAKERFVVLHTDSSGKRKSLNKRGTRYNNHLSNSPENPYKLIVCDGESLPWSRLI